MSDRWNKSEYIASLRTLPLPILCDRLRGRYPHGISYGQQPLQVEAARRLEEMEQEIKDRSRTHI
jgi:hypothetical protein